MIWTSGRSLRLVPRGEAVWRRPKGASNIYLASSAPDAVKDLLEAEAADSGFLIDTGTYSDIHRSIVDPNLVIKETRLPMHGNQTFVSRLCGLTALRLNVALSLGLPRIGEQRLLPNGATMTAPDYYGVYVASDLLRIVMSFEGGEPIYAGDGRAGTHLDRRAIFDAALRAVGVPPVESGLYDDIPTGTTDTNLLSRYGNGGQAEIVALDLCDVPLTRTA